VEEAKPNFRLCPKCANWVCQATCWNQKRGLCYECAPSVETELAAAQAQATIEQLQEKVRQQDLTRDIDLTSEAAALCPHCGVRTQGAKFCPECGKPLRPKGECPRCGTKVEPRSKFCPECGQKMV
jgi:membrane protease subunit (stomatin/prohibitin family)